VFALKFIPGWGFDVPFWCVSVERRGWHSPMSWLTYQKAFGKPILHSLPSSKGAFVKVACADQ
jgi:hypothetical protein